MVLPGLPLWSANEDSLTCQKQFMLHDSTSQQPVRFRRLPPVSQLIPRDSTRTGPRRWSGRAVQLHVCTFPARSLHKCTVRGGAPVTQRAAARGTGLLLAPGAGRSVALTQRSLSWREAGSQNRCAGGRLTEPVIRLWSWYVGSILVGRV